MKSTSSQADLTQVIDDYEKEHVQDVNMSGFAAPKISTVGNGTKGAVLLDPPPARISMGNHSWASAEEFAEIEEKYTPELDRKMAHVARKSGHGGSDLKEAWRLIDCLHNGLPLDQDVYDAAAWSSILPLTDWSVRNNSSPIKVPDFTAGSWKMNERNMDIALEKGGGNTKILM